MMHMKVIEETNKKSSSTSGNKIMRYKRRLKKKHKQKPQHMKEVNRHNKAEPDYDSLLRTVTMSFFEPRSLDQHLHKIVRLARKKQKKSTIK